MNLDGVKLQDEIAIQQMSILEFAKAAGVSTVAIYRIFNGGRSNTRTAGKIAAALKKSPRELLLSPVQVKGVI